MRWTTGITELLRARCPITRARTGAAAGGRPAAAVPIAGCVGASPTHPEAAHRSMSLPRQAEESDRRGPVLMGLPDAVVVGAAAVMADLVAAAGRAVADLASRPGPGVSA